MDVDVAATAVADCRCHDCDALLRCIETAAQRLKKFRRLLMVITEYQRFHWHGVAGI